MLSPVLVPCRIPPVDCQPWELGTGTSADQAPAAMVNWLAPTSVWVMRLSFSRVVSP